MSVRIVGPQCAHCVEMDVRPPRGVFRDGLCSQHWLQATPFERSMARDWTPPLSRFDALVASGSAHTAETPEFDADLRAWLGAA